MWIWPPLMQRELDKFRANSNSQRMRKQPDKILPSGTSPDTAYLFPENFGGVECLQPVDIHVVDQLLADLQPEKDAYMDWGVDPEFRNRVDSIYKLQLRSPAITMETVWVIFSAIAALL